MKSHARVVVIGGGAMGVGLLYHLTKEGWTDVVLVEKGELTSGSTWHAAGLVPHFIGSLSMAKVHLYGSELYKSLEAETGQATGWHGCGAIRLARTADEVDWFHGVKGLLDVVGAECHLIGPSEIRELHPFLEVDDVRLGFYTVGDGHTDPAGSTNAMAAGARRGGAEIYRHTRALDTRRRGGGEWEVMTDKGNIVCEHVVNAAGCFTAQVGAWVGLKLPVVNMIHQYLVTEDLADVDVPGAELPVVRDPRASCYYRQERQGLIVGPYEMDNAQAWGLDGIDWGFDMELLPPDLDRLTPSLEFAMQRIPALRKLGIKRVVSGPITHTPDGGFLMGPAPGLRNYWLCAAASIGITQGPGAGKYLAQWMVHGQTEINVREMDPRRFGPHMAAGYAVEKSIDEYQQMYQVRRPGEFRGAGRPLKTSPIYDRLKERGAVFGEAFGWERPLWFALGGEAEHHSFRRSNAFAAVGAECRAVRERVGVLDLSSFAKYEVSGADAEAFLDRVCANRMPRHDGRIVLAHMLTSLGGIEGEATVTRLQENRYYLLSAIVAQLHDHDWLVQHIRDGEDVTVSDVTDDYSVLVIAGPRSRSVVQTLTSFALANEDFPWLHARTFDVAGVAVRALRVSYVGELGWELHHRVEDMPRLYEALMEAGAEHGVVDFGMHAVNSMRMEKAYKAWGSELTTEVTPVEADIERFVRLDKDFIGRDALLARKREGIATKLCYVTVEADDADCLGNEPVWDGKRLIGVVTGGAFGHTVNQSIAFAYVEPPYAEPGQRFDIDVLGERRAATVLPGPLYDPRNERLKS